MPDVKGSMLMLLIKRTKPPQPYRRQFSSRDRVPGGRPARCCVYLCGLYSDIWM